MTNHPISGPSLKLSCTAPLCLWDNYQHHHHYFAWSDSYPYWILSFAARRVLAHAVPQRSEPLITPRRKSAVELENRLVGEWGSSPSPLSLSQASLFHMFYTLGFHPLLYLKYFLLLKQWKLLPVNLGAPWSSSMPRAEAIGFLCFQPHLISDWENCLVYVTPEITSNVQILWLSPNPNVVIYSLSLSPASDLQYTCAISRVWNQVSVISFPVSFYNFSDFLKQILLGCHYIYFMTLQFDKHSDKRQHTW